jgi:hypothetical protein
MYQKRKMAHLSTFKTDLPRYPPAVTRKQLKKSKPDQVFTLSKRPPPLGFTLHVNTMLLDAGNYSKSAISV